MTSAPSSALEITLVRHGESEWNDSRLVQGQNNTARLTTRGREQAQTVARTLQELGFDALFTSDLDRANETASIIGVTLGLVPMIDPLLRERCFGIFEGGPLASLTSDVTGIADDVLVDPDAHPENGEAFRDVVARAGLFIERMNSMPSVRRPLVVTHGGTIRALRAHASGEPLEGLLWDRVGNCSVWTIYANNVA